METHNNALLKSNITDKGGILIILYIMLKLAKKKSMIRLVYFRQKKLHLNILSLRNTSKHNFSLAMITKIVLSLNTSSLERYKMVKFSNYTEGMEWLV